MKICEAYASLLDAFVDGELDAKQADGVRSHLAQCPACAAYVSDALALRAALLALEDVEAPEGLADGVMAAIRAHAAPQKKKKNRWAMPLLSAAACAALVFAVWRAVPDFGAGGVMSAGAPAASAPAASAAEPRSEDTQTAPAARSEQDAAVPQETADGGSADAPETAPQNQSPVPYSLEAPAAQDGASAGGEQDAESAPKTAGTGAAEPPDAGAPDAGAPGVNAVLTAPEAPASTQTASYCKWATITLEQAGSALTEYAGAEAADPATGRPATAYELLPAEFDGIVAALETPPEVFTAPAPTEGGPSCLSLACLYVLA